MAAFITLPGIGGSDEAHWQTIWEKSNPAMTRFEPRDWNNPDLSDWSTALENAIGQSREPPILVAHSLACLLIPHWVTRGGSRGARAVRGAFLVAVPDPDGPAFPAVEAASFRPVPQTRLPFPALVVASDDDPYGGIGYARARAAAWGAGFVSVGACGHLNSASGLGDWLLGAMLLEAFTAGIAR